MKGPLDSRQLMAFAILARTGSFTRTARELFLTQSAVSHAMKALESDIGCRLLDRMGKKVTLTQAGEHLLKHAEVVLRELQTAREGIEHLGKWGRGHLRVGATVSLCANLLPGVFREFKEFFPQSLIQLVPGDSREIAEALNHHKIDLGIALDTSSDHRIHGLPLFTDELIFVASPRHPWVHAGRAAREDISRQNIIVYNKTSHTFKCVDDYFREEGLVLNTVTELGSMEAIRELVKLNLGVAVTAPWQVHQELADGTLSALPLGRRKLKRDWVIQYRQGRQLSLAEETFVGLLKTAAGCLNDSRPMSRAMTVRPELPQVT